MIKLSKSRLRKPLLKTVSCQASFRINVKFLKANVNLFTKKLFTLGER